jgi:ribonuclease HI
VTYDCIMEEDGNPVRIKLKTEQIEMFRSRNIPITILEPLPERVIKIYVDGSAKGNPGVGGSGVVMEAWRDNDLLKRSIIGLHHPHTTCNQAELKALIAALETLDKSKTNGWIVEIYADSEYVVKGVKEWMPRWKLAGWRNSRNKRIANIELWQQVDQIYQSSYQMIWVPGHTGNPGNEMADKIANEATYSGKSFNR